MLVDPLWILCCHNLFGLFSLALSVASGISFLQIACVSRFLQFLFFCNFFQDQCHQHLCGFFAYLGVLYVALTLSKVFIDVYSALVHDAYTDIYLFLEMPPLMYSIFLLKMAPFMYVLFLLEVPPLMYFQFLLEMAPLMYVPFLLELTPLMYILFLLGMCLHSIKFHFL